MRQPKILTHNIFHSGVFTHKLKSPYSTALLIKIACELPTQPHTFPLAQSQQQRVMLYYRLEQGGSRKLGSSWVFQPASGTRRKICAVLARSTMVSYYDVHGDDHEHIVCLLHPWVKIRCRYRTLLTYYSNLACKFWILIPFLWRYVAENDDKRKWNWLSRRTLQISVLWFHVCFWLYFKPLSFLYADSSFKLSLCRGLY